MATLKEHQAAMVDLLANGSGIPASASRLAHAMHDVVAMLIEAFPNLPLSGDSPQGNRRVVSEETFTKLTSMVSEQANPTPALKELMNRRNATTPGLNDKAISKREKALKTDSPAKWPTPAEQRVKELENTCMQLRKQSAKYRATIAGLKADVDLLKALVFAYENGAEPEQAGCRKEDTQVCEHTANQVDEDTGFCRGCGKVVIE